MTPPDEYPLYGDHAAAEPAPTRRTGHAAPACPNCGSHDWEDGFVEGTGDSLVRYYVGPRASGLFGVKRFGLERRTVVARRCLTCSRLDLFAGEITA